MAPVWRGWARPSRRAVGFWAHDAQSRSSPWLRGPQKAAIRLISSDASARSQTLFQRYQRASEKSPYKTQVWSFLALWFVGDVGAQLFFPAQVPAQPGEYGQDGVKKKPYDLQRTLRHLFIGATVAVPTYEWFKVISHSFNYRSKLASLALKVVVQQAVYTPVFNTYFFTMHSLLAGASLPETYQHLRHALPKSVANGIGVWTAAAVISFTAVPVQLRGVFMGSTAVGWQIYLSWMNQNVALKRAAHVQEEQNS